MAGTAPPAHSTLFGRPRKPWLRVFAELMPLLADRTVVSRVDGPRTEPTGSRRGRFGEEIARFTPDPSILVLVAAPLRDDVDGNLRVARLDPGKTSPCKSSAISCFSFPAN
jgi:hypothetical protein